MRALLLALALRHIYLETRQRMVQLVIYAIHCTAMLALIAIAVMQVKHLSLRLSLAQLAALLRLDIAYSWSALITLISGFIIWLTGSELPGNLLSQPLFLAKLILFAGVALVSTYPSMTFLKLKNGALMSRMSISPAVIFVVKLEVVMLLVLMLLAVAPRIL